MMYAPCLSFCLDLSRAIKEAKDASKGTVRTERKLEEKVKKGERPRVAVLPERGLGWQCSQRGWQSDPMQQVVF